MEHDCSVVIMFMDVFYREGEESDLWVSSSRIDELWNAFHSLQPIHCSEVTEASLLTTIHSILKERRSCIIGELGKAVAERSAAVAKVSSKIKEKFGGLKRFCESHSEVFVVGVDHRFNPTVFLKDTVTAEDMVMIKSGRTPTHLADLKSVKQQRNAAPSHHQRGDTYELQIMSTKQATSHKSTISTDSRSIPLQQQQQRQYRSSHSLLSERFNQSLLLMLDNRRGREDLVVSLRPSAFDSSLDQKKRCCTSSQEKTQEQEVVVL